MIACSGAQRKDIQDFEKVPQKFKKSASLSRKASSLVRRCLASKRNAAATTHSPDARAKTQPMDDTRHAQLQLAAEAAAVAAQAQAAGAAAQAQAHPITPGETPPTAYDHKGELKIEAVEVKLQKK